MPWKEGPASISSQGASSAGTQCKIIFCAHLSYPHPTATGQSYDQENSHVIIETDIKN